MFDIEVGDVIALRELGLSPELEPFARVVQRAVTEIAQAGDVVLVRLAPINAIEWPLGDYILNNNVVSDEFTSFRITGVEKNVFKPLASAVA